MKQKGWGIKDLKYNFIIPYTITMTKQGCINKFRRTEWDNLPWKKIKKKGFFCIEVTISLQKEEK